MTDDTNWKAVAKEFHARQIAFAIGPETGEWMPAEAASREILRLRDSNAKVTDARDNLLDEVGRLRAKNAAYHERLHYPCDGCPGCSSSDCPDALHIAQIDLAVWQHEAKRLQARVAELEAAMAQRMGVYAAPKDERQVGS